MVVPAQKNVKLANENTGHAQGVVIILCRFPNYRIIYHIGPVYYCPVHPTDTISLVTLKCYVGF